jgi:hypothetical protein
MKENKTYAILKEVTEYTLWIINRDIFDSKGNHFVPKSVRPQDKYILLEITMREDGTEFYSNALSSSDFNYMQSKMRDFNSFFDYITGKMKLFSSPKVQPLFSL